MTQSAGQLVVIATPIGNLGDLSPRAAEWLQKADILACEDTRMTRKLLTLTGLRTAAKFMPYHDHNGQTMRPKLLDALQSGKMVALVSDAGTPLVSDPGYKLVAACHDAGISVTAIPGPSAVLAGLAAAACQVTGFYLPDLCHIVRKPQKQPFANLPILASQASGLTHRAVLVPACKSCMKYLAIGWPSLLAN